MKTFILLFCMLLSSSLVAEEVKLATLSGELIPPGDYTISAPTPLVINHETFHTYEIQKVKSLNDFCVQGPAKIKLDRALLAANLASTLVAGYGVLKTNPTNDKQRHVLAGYIVGNLTTGFFQLVLPEDMRNRKLVAFLGGLGASIIVGIGKEYRDSKGYGNVDKKDAIATALGGFGGSVTMSFGDVKKALKKISP